MSLSTKSHYSTQFTRKKIIFTQFLSQNCLTIKINDLILKVGRYAYHIIFTF